MSSQPRERPNEPPTAPVGHQHAVPLPQLDSLPPPFILLANPPYLIHMQLRPRSSSSYFIQVNGTHFPTIRLISSYFSKQPSSQHYPVCLVFFFLYHLAPRNLTPCQDYLHIPESPPTGDYPPSTSALMAFFTRVCGYELVGSGPSGDSFFIFRRDTPFA